jgi:ATP-dependent helicase HrpB
VVNDDLVLDESRSAADSPAARAENAAVLAEAAHARGPRTFVRDPDVLDRFLARAAFAREHVPSLPAVDDDALRAALRDLCDGLRSFAELRDAGLFDAVRARFTPAQLAAIDRLAPDRLSLPRRANVRIEYDPGKPPWIASRLQDFFGLRESPRVAAGRVPLVLHLLAPNQRAVQVTTDLAGFWEKHYPSLRKTLMRRYPRHAWPETPQ